MTRQLKSLHDSSHIASIYLHIGSLIPGAPSIQIIPSLGPKVFKYDLLRDIWSPAELDPLGRSTSCWAPAVFYCSRKSSWPDRTLHRSDSKWLFLLGVDFLGVLLIGALLFGVYIRAPDFWGNAQPVRRPNQKAPRP